MNTISVTGGKKTIAGSISRTIARCARGDLRVGKNGRCDQRRALQQKIRRRVITGCGRHAIPRHIYFVPELPRTFSGKVVRQQLAV
ncbi:acyl-CoA synthetase [Brenneria izadpanahii]|uniref:Acyl-CoA synthetase n=1 Tax=Brenneria izadpanahii TaxID=2722756 RepID=A0ABX7UQC9_9GAMM|nr:acyl-CoA synthetase [Brenneria izadpanahii]